MTCPRCHQETPPDTYFRPECGAKLVPACGHCGTPNAPGLAIATTMYRAMDMRFWLEQAETEMKELG